MKIKITILAILSIVVVGIFQNCILVQHGFFLSAKTSAQTSPAAVYFPAEITRALLITNHTTLNAIYDEYDLGYLLGKLGEYETDRIKMLNSSFTRSPGKYFYFSIKNSVKSQEDYRAYARSAPVVRNGPVVPNGSEGQGDYTMNAIFKDWRVRESSGVFSAPIPESALSAITSASGLKSNKFRLLAISNRLDLAGETDDRITGGSTELPRYLGEIHLIYGLVDAEYEALNKKPFPMTFVLSYMLPPLNFVSGSDVFQHSNYSRRPIPAPSVECNNKGQSCVVRQERQLQFLHNSLYGIEPILAETPLPSLRLDQWKIQISQWAKLWAGLNKFEVTDPVYMEKLRHILSLAVQPENFLSMKSNTNFNVTQNGLTTSHFELREWYVFKSGVIEGETNPGQLIFRYVRREPYRCLTNSAVLQNTLDHYWNPIYNDLDMTTRRDLSQSPTQDQYRAGYSLLRDNKRPLILPFVQKMNFADGRVGLYWTPECGTSELEMPYGMLTGTNRDEGVTYDNATEQKDQLFMITPFARVQPTTPIWRLQTVSEPKRHAFAMRTCTGCHSAEGATYGFHIFPRLQNQNSLLSPFLTGETIVGKNPFVYNNPADTLTSSSGVYNYKYSEIERRRRWAEKLADIENRRPFLYNSLKVPDALDP